MIGMFAQGRLRTLMSAAGLPAKWQSLPTARAEAPLKSYLVQSRESLFMTP